MKIIFASSNKGKINEINELVKNKKIEIVPQGEVGVTEIEETGLTFVENALLKARYATQVTGLPALADDSGLVVPILNGEPGIFSARYAGNEANHAKNIEKLLFNLKDIPEEKRTAFFYCVIVMLRSPTDPCPIICEGIWHGSVLHSPRGNKGFGYDPIFYDPRYDSSAAELSMDVKNQVSHRGQAMKKLISSLDAVLTSSSPARYVQE